MAERWRLAPGFFLLMLACGAPFAAQEPAPIDLAATALDGSPRELSSLRGQIVVLNFWATWCAPCREELPMLGRVARRHSGRGVTVVALSVDTPDAINDVLDVATREASGVTVWTGGTTLQMEQLGLEPSLPATVILDGEGQIAARMQGVVTKRELTRWLDALRSGGPAPEPPGAVEEHAGEHSEEQGDEHGDERHHEHGEGEEEHQHGGVGMEGASLVPS